MKKIVSLSAALVLVLSAFAGCGDSEKEKTTSSASDNTTVAATTEADTENENRNKSDKKAEAADFVGKWQCDEIIANGQSTDNLMGVDAYALFQIELNEDNTGSFLSFLYSGFFGEDEPLKLTWEVNGSDSVSVALAEEEIEKMKEQAGEGVSFEAEEEMMTLRMDGDRLIIEEDEDEEGFQICLSKVDEFTPIPEDMEMSFDFEGEFNAEIEAEDGSINIETSAG